MGLTVGANNQFIVFILAIVMIIVGIIEFPLSTVWFLGFILGVVCIVLGILGVIGTVLSNMTLIRIFMFGSIGVFVFSAIVTIISIATGHIANFVLSLIVTAFLAACVFFSWRYQKGTV